jgi:putative FmdB family regulatory protein
MPLFEYECKECGERFEALVMGSHRPACPTCGSRNLEKQTSAFAVSSGSGRSSGGADAPRPSACGGGG